MAAPKPADAPVTNTIIAAAPKTMLAGENSLAYWHRGGAARRGGALAGMFGNPRSTRLMDLSPNMVRDGGCGCLFMAHPIN
ncbi:hypothetical protein BpKM390_29060 [Burkholderia pseudomallei]|nr:hypothetical protein TKS_27790 [Burkholderia pseudomallei]BEH61661.1 hypothetical protein BpKM390_29060 [Burkholderia pseudomallei]